MGLEGRSEGEQSLERTLEIELEIELEREGATGRIYAKEIELLDELVSPPPP
jgi:hypothetical protein